MNIVPFVFGQIGLSGQYKFFSATLGCFFSIFINIKKIRVPVHFSVLIEKAVKFATKCTFLTQNRLNHTKLKKFLKPVWEGKMHGVKKIGVFRPLFCVGMLGKSTNYSTGTRPLCSTF